jgi:cell division protein FtsZ
MTQDSSSSFPSAAKIKVIGIGGGGGNAINTMIQAGLDSVEFISANTDLQSLQLSLADHKIQVGKELTKGLGAGADPDIGRDAALEDRHAIQEAIGDADMVFITAGMGGGTGTGGASIVSQIAREMGALTVAVVTKPFQFEGRRRQKQADQGIQRLRESVDTLITIPNQRLLQVASSELTMIDAFQMADNVLLNAVRGISDIINVPGTINVDFADVKTVMSSMGQALMGVGSASGQSRASEAARQAISSPLLEDVDIVGATGILINISAGANVTLMEVNEACTIVHESAHEDANIIFGAVIDEALEDEIRVTVIATGFPSEDQLNAGESFEVPNPRRPILKSPQRAPLERRARTLLGSSPVVPQMPVNNYNEAVYQSQADNEPDTSLTESIEADPEESLIESEPNSSATSPLINSDIARGFAQAHDLTKLTIPQELSSLAQESFELINGESDDFELPKLEDSPRETGFDFESFGFLEDQGERSGATTRSSEFGAGEGTGESIDALDERLDQAMELAEKLRSDVDIADDDEFLDIPAFLRNTKTESDFPK